MQEPLKGMTMFDSSESVNRAIDLDQFVEWDNDVKSIPAPSNCVTLIGRECYGAEVEWSGYVSVDKDLQDAEAFLAGLYPQL